MSSFSGFYEAKYIFPMSTVGAQEPGSFKVILVGSSGVGKTSLIRVFFGTAFENQESSTVAPASFITSINLAGEKINLHIWDTAGQECYQSLSRTFYRNSNVALVCYDTQREDTIEMWISRVREQVPDCKILLVTTKVDMLTQDQQIDCVARGNQHVTEFNCSTHSMTSASSGYGVREIFYEAAKVCSSLEKPKNEEQTVNLENKENNNEEKKSCC
ncbi:small GTP-binding protein [Histomonas meleagridis]|uniref:small GTP-binding protein n=1 Tax=Histomonas meleagridis TaxID=135588 RepID=UPI0035599A84|nr:small GTP-binding protein [Histomonas meleagridis]KAH0796433.1 small GTP-binding protein [Histomonas meleagridis]